MIGGVIFKCPVFVPEETPCYYHKKCYCICDQVMGTPEIKSASKTRVESKVHHGVSGADENIADKLLSHMRGGPLTFFDFK